MHIQVGAVSSDETSPLPGTGEKKEDIFTKGNLCPNVRQKGRRYRAFPVSVVYLFPVAQNNPYAKVAYFELAYSNPFHFLQCKIP